MLGLEICDGAEVICLRRIGRKPVCADKAAPHAAVNDDQPFARPMVYPFRSHHSQTARCPISRLDVDVLGPQARGTVIPVAAVRQRDSGTAAILACEALILGRPADGAASGLKK